MARAGRVWWAGWLGLGACPSLQSHYSRATGGESDGRHVRDVNESEECWMCQATLSVVGDSCCK